MSAVALDRAPADGRAPLVNKRELARLLGVTLPTLDRALADDPDYPVVTRGSNGREWEFDPAAVRAHLAERAEQAEREATARREQLAQFALPIEATAPEGALGDTAQQRLAMAKALREERTLALESGMLVSTAELRKKLELAFTALSRDLMSMPRAICQEFNLPDEIERAVTKRVGDALRRAVANLQASVGAGAS